MSMADDLSLWSCFIRDSPHGFMLVRAVAFDVSDYQTHGCDWAKKNCSNITIASGHCSATAMILKCNMVCFTAPSLPMSLYVAAIVGTGNRAG